MQYDLFANNYVQFYTETRIHLEQLLINYTHRFNENMDFDQIVNQCNDTLIETNIYRK